MGLRRRLALALALAGAVLSCAPAAAQSAGAALFGVTADAGGAKQVIRLPAPGADGVLGRYLYTPSIAAGLGASEVGVDRAWLGQTQIILFRRIGKRVIAQFENTRFRALDANAGETRAVETSFAPSTVWAGDAIDQPDGSVAVDIAGFLLRDSLDVASRLKRAKAGSYKLAQSLSYIDASESAAFPANAEFQSVLTFQTEEPGMQIRRVVPDARSIIVATGPNISIAVAYKSHTASQTSASWVSMT